MCGEIYTEQFTEHKYTEGEIIQIPRQKVTILLKGSVVSCLSLVTATQDKQGPVYQIYLSVASYSSHCIVI